MSNLYKAPESAPTKEVNELRTAFDKTRNHLSRILKSSLLLIALAAVLHFFLADSKGALSEIIIPNLLGIGLLLLLLYITAIIPMTLWGLIQGFTEAKNKK